MYVDPIVELNNLSAANKRQAVKIEKLEKALDASIASLTSEHRVHVIVSQQRDAARKDANLFALAFWAMCVVSAVLAAFIIIDRIY